MNPEKWETCDPNDSSGVMISNLPLLFVHGKPTSLEYMSLEDFEKFIPFMVQCSTGEAATVPWSQLPRPPWWPSRLPFRVPSANSSCNKMLMVRIVERCYSYHGCPYLLQFCSSLIDVMPACGYRFTDNRDGTSSMYHGTTGKLLVTFRNENRDYDKLPDPTRALQKKLLSSMHHGKEKKRNIMVQPAVSDVYLCDKCDDEFLSLKEVQNHEKQCKGNTSMTISMPSPEPETFEDIISTDEQVPFLSLMGLQPAKHTGINAYVSPIKKQRTPIKSVSYNHFHLDSVDITSPFGCQILSRLRNYGKLEIAQHNVMRYERYIHAPLEDYEGGRTRHSNRWMVTFKRKWRDRAWTHFICFTKEQKNERRRTISTGLNYRSRCLILKCRPLHIKVKRLKPCEIEELSRPKIIKMSISLIDIYKEDTIDKIKSVSNGNLIRIPLHSSIALDSRNSETAVANGNNEKLIHHPSTSKNIMANGNSRQKNFLTCKTVTLTKLCGSSESSSKRLALSKELTAVNGEVETSRQKNIFKKPVDIEVIDLLSDDDEDTSKQIVSSLINGKYSKNGHSHWSSRNSGELGRNSSELTNGSISNLMSSSINNKKCKYLSRLKPKVPILDKENSTGELNKSSYLKTSIAMFSSSNHNRKFTKRPRKMNEVLKLKNDECRELNKRGLKLLRDANECSKKILTRRLAKKNLPTLQTHNNQFTIGSLLKSQPFLDSMKNDVKVENPTAILDEDCNSKSFSRYRRNMAFHFEKKKKFPVAKNSGLSYGKTITTKLPRGVRELINLSKDECKEIRCRGFHPADVIRVVSDEEREGKINTLHSILLNKPSSYYLSTKKLYSRLNVTIDENTFHNSSETRSIVKDNLHRKLYLLKDKKYVAKIENLLNGTLASNARLQPRFPLNPTENSRRTHRQLIRSQRGMCVLNYLLPRFR